MRYFAMIGLVCLLCGCTQQSKEEYKAAGSDLVKAGKETGQAISTDINKAGAETKEKVNEAKEKKGK